ncbi:MAG: extracellular solute-binding protein, partial [Myxococcales bacterium]|nr:extracellular solute-binding protein [Myxococcales bacterium]
DPRYAGRISVLDSKGDVFDQAQLAAGLGVNCKDKKALREVVFPMLLAQKKLLRAYDPHPERALASGETWIAQVDGGDLLRAQETRKSLRFVLPEEGAPYWVDYLSIPANAESPDTALRFLEFLLDPEIAAINANALHFATPNKTALDRGLVRDAGIAEIYARERGGPPLPRSLNWAGSVKELVDALWLELRGA